MRTFDLVEIEHPTKGRLLVRAGTEGDYKTEEATPGGEPDLSDYHVGGGWYDVPGEDGKVRKDEALELLGGA